MGDVDSLDNPYWLGGIEDFLEIFEGYGRLGGEDFRLDVLVGSAPAVEAFDEADAVAEDGRFFVISFFGGLGHLFCKLAKDGRAF